MQAALKVEYGILAYLAAALSDLLLLVAILNRFLSILLILDAETCLSLIVTPAFLNSVLII